MLSPSISYFVESRAESEEKLLQEDSLFVLSSTNANNIP